MGANDIPSDELELLHKSANDFAIRNVANYVEIMKNRVRLPDGALIWNELTIDQLLGEVLAVGFINGYESHRERVKPKLLLV